VIVTQAEASAAKLRDAIARDDFTIEELVESADRFLRALVPDQTRYKVRDRPDVRTIRYYTTQELLPKPVSYHGGRARYTGRHLARLLLIKKLQAEHHTLQQIARTLSNAGDDAVLAALLLQAAPSRPTDGRPASGRQAAITVPAPAPSTPNASSPAAVPAAARFRRFALAHGASADVPETVLADAEQRRQLADALIALARALRTNAPGEEP
jgi:DNA-binding transcriptional MerR regulator